MASSPKTALVLVDPYNDFLHPSGKLTPLLQASLDANDTVNHIKQAVTAARKFKIPVYYALHQQWKPGFGEGWNHMTDSNSRQRDTHFFAEDSFGTQLFEGLEPRLDNGDVTVSRHFNSNAFWNTDLDYQLRQRDISRIVFAGLTSNTCLESTARHATENGYHITMLHDATAGFSVQLSDVARDLIYPLFANEVLSVDEWVARQEADGAKL